MSNDFMMSLHLKDLTVTFNVFSFFSYSSGAMKMEMRKCISVNVIYFQEMILYSAQYCVPTEYKYIKKKMFLHFPSTYITGWYLGHSVLTDFFPVMYLELSNSSCTSTAMLLINVTIHRGRGPHLNSY